MSKNQARILRNVLGEFFSLLSNFPFVSLSLPPHLEDYIQETPHCRPEATTTSSSGTCDVLSSVPFSPGVLNEYYSGDFNVIAFGDGREVENKFSFRMQTGLIEGPP